jgi:4'-phosphopantetheinyl transferase
MPQLLEKQINAHCTLGLWEISESCEELEAMIRLNDNEKEIFSGFRNETRRKHWLSYRLLIRQMLGSHDVDVRYQKSGKPFMAAPDGHISVTHSGCFSSVIYSRKVRVGIDIEKVHEKIVRVSHKFLSDAELTAIVQSSVHQQLVTMWAAKEALYKLYGRSSVDFREQLYIEPFKPAVKGTLTGHVLVKDKDECFRLHYEKVADYMLVWVVG